MMVVVNFDSGEVLGVAEKSILKREFKNCQQPDEDGKMDITGEGLIMAFPIDKVFDIQKFKKQYGT